jgi:hypothetical protein
VFVTAAGAGRSRGGLARAGVLLAGLLAANTVVAIASTLGFTGAGSAPLYTVASLVAAVASLALGLLYVFGARRHHARLERRFAARLPVQSGCPPTRSFGAGNRESHGAAPFHERFTEPELSDDDTVNPCRAADSIICADARDMQAVDDCSVALVVTSPPYFAGKSTGRPRRATFPVIPRVPGDAATCCGMSPGARPGGRMAVNVANLGRKPYRSLAGDVVGSSRTTSRSSSGVVVWQKAAGDRLHRGRLLPVGRQSVLRDVTGVVVASKGRFDRAVSRAARNRTPVREHHLEGSSSRRRSTCGRSGRTPAGSGIQRRSPSSSPNG